ncbi:MAG: hypothetical protein FWE67_05575, partial [Planctomycetaceae bacterium]|nr:hypothetical protein [Planctomycetaceae bacterium]
MTKKSFAVAALFFGTAVLFAVVSALAQEAPAPAPVPEPAPPPAVESPPAPASETPTQSAAPETPAESPPKRVYEFKRSYDKLLHPAVAARVGLNDQQRAEVNRLMALRAQEIAKTTDEEKWAEIYEQSEQKIADILTPAQKALFPKVF